MGEWFASRKTFHWKFGEARGEIMWLGMDDPKDASKLQSRALGAFFMDEPAPAAESGGISEMIFDTAMTRLRQPRMHWYAAKLAENNPDEGHWTYRKFVDPGTPGYKVWQTGEPENLKHLPSDYYAKMRRQWAGRPDLVARFADGKFGFQRLGSAVTPQWNDLVHLADGLEPLPGRELHLLWDFGLTPCCIITQLVPTGHLNVLDALYDEENALGAFDLIEQIVKPALAERYEKCTWSHIGDPAGTKRSEIRVDQTPVGVIRRELGGGWRSGPVTLRERVDPLRWALAQMRDGRGLIRVDRKRARGVHHALRGGWHFHVSRGGVVSTEPVKNHPACVDLETEILTLDGWRPHDAIEPGTPVYGFEPGRGLVVDQVAAVRVFDGPFAIDTLETDAVSIAATPNHKLYGRRRITRSRCYEERRMLWSEAHTGWQVLAVPGDTRGIGGTRARLSDAMVRLAAWVFTDGTFRKDDRDVLIKQFTYWNDVARLAQCFADTKLNENHHSIRIFGDTSVLLRLLMPGKCPSGEFIRLMTPTQRRLFLHEAMRVDGTTSGRWQDPSADHLLPSTGRAWVLALSDREADALQHLATLAGHATSRTQVGSKRLTLLTVQRRGAEGGGRWVKWQPTEHRLVDRVWCPTTSTGWWVSRRSGRVCLTGNSDLGDAMGYGCAVLFPKGALRKRKGSAVVPSAPSYFRGATTPRGPLGFERPGAQPPAPGLEATVRADPFGRLERDRR
jgi:hypothetical protein